MIQCADDDPVDAGRIMGSPGHGGWMRRPRISPGRSSIYNAKGQGIALQSVPEPISGVTLDLAKIRKFIGGQPHGALVDMRIDTIHLT